MFFATSVQLLLVIHISSSTGFSDFKSSPLGLKRVTFYSSDASIQNGMPFNRGCNKVITGQFGNRKSLSTKAAADDSTHQKDYEFLDCGNLKRLERFGDVTVVRSCPSAIWPKKISSAEWEKSTNVVYDGSSGKNGKWTGLSNIGENWKVEFEKTKTILPGKQIKKSEITNTDGQTSDQKVAVKSGGGSDFSNDNKITFTLSCSDQGQVGVFPEQQQNWKWINDSIRKSLQTEIAQNTQKEKEINPDTVISEDYVGVTDYSKISVNSRKNPPKIRTNNNSNNSSKKGKIIVEENVKNIPMRKILNGFAYTGGSSLAALLAYGSSDKHEISLSAAAAQNNGADNVNHIPIEVQAQIQVQVVHLDAAKSSVQWALRNAAASGLVINDGGSSELATESEEKEGGEEEKEEEDVDGRDVSKSDDTENGNLQSSSSSSSSSTPYSARWITDDCLSFLDREIRRGNKYDGLIFDPPAFGRASNGKIWKIEKDLPVLVEELIPKLLSDKPLFVLLSCHDVAWPPERLAESLSVAMSTVARNAMLSDLKALKKSKANQPVLDKDKSKNNISKDRDSDKKKNNTTIKKAKIVLPENENSNIKSIVVAGGILEYGAMVLTPKQYSSNNVRKSEIGNPLPLGGFARWSAVVAEEE